MMNVIVNPEVYGRYRPTNRSTHTLAVESLLLPLSL